METFWGINSAGWTAIGSVITGIGIFIALVFPILTHIITTTTKRKRIIKIVYQDLDLNIGFLQSGITKGNLKPFLSMDWKQWEKCESIAKELFDIDVFILTGFCYTNISRFCANIQRLEEREPLSKETIAQWIEIAVNLKTTLIIIQKSVIKQKVFDTE